MKRIRAYALAASALLLGGAGCLLPGVGGSGIAPADGGVFRSTDQGAVWTQKTQVYAVGGVQRNFSMANVISLAADPSDPQTLYAGTDGAGLLYTYNVGEGWSQPDQLRTGYIQSIAVDPWNKCVVYATLGPQLFKTEDCARTWGSVYDEGRPNVVVTSVTVDPQHSNIVWFGTNAGDLFRSSDAGKSWAVAHRLANGILKILLAPGDGSHMYIATPEQGVYRSLDGGVSWGDDINQGLKQYGGAFAVKDIVFLDTRDESLLLATQYGLIKSLNRGDTWAALTLLTPPGGAQIQAVAVNPSQSKQIFYATNSTVYRTDDGGAKWTTRKLPSTRPPTQIMFNQANPQVMFMSVKSIKK